MVKGDVLFLQSEMSRRRKHRSGSADSRTSNHSAASSDCGGRGRRGACRGRGGRGNRGGRGGRDDQHGGGRQDDQTRDAARGGQRGVQRGIQRGGQRGGGNDRGRRGRGDRTPRDDGQKPNDAAVLNDDPGEFLLGGGGDGRHTFGVVFPNLKVR